MSQSTAAARVPTRPVVRPAGRERPQPRLRVVAPAPRRSAGGLALLSVGLLGLGLLLLLLLNISIGKGAYALTELRLQQRQLAEDKQALAEQVEASGAPDKLAARASKLGMVENPNPVFFKLDGSIQGKPQVALAPPKPRPAPKAAAKKAVAAAVAAATAGKQKVADDTQKAADREGGSKTGTPAVGAAGAATAMGRTTGETSL